VTVAAALPPTGPPAAGGPRKHGHDEHHGPKSHDD
jgi:hypothetical protein